MACNEAQFVDVLWDLKKAGGSHRFPRLELDVQGHVGWISVKNL